VPSASATEVGEPAREAAEGGYNVNAPKNRGGGNVDEGFFLHDLHLSIPREYLFGIGLARQHATRINSERKNRTHSHDHPEGH
jgi:hypothetical protein